MRGDQALHTLDSITAHFKAQSLVLCVAFVGMPCISNAQTPAEDVAAQVRLKGTDAISRSLLGGMRDFPNQTQRSGF
jgi:hypothetical protein